MNQVAEPKSNKIYHALSGFVEFALIGLFVSLTFSIAFTEIFIVASLIGWLAKKALDRDFSFLKDPMYLILTFFVACVGLSVANSEFFHMSFRGMIKATKGIIIFFILIDTFRTREQVIRLTKLLIGLFLFVLLNGVWQYFTGHDILRGKEVGYFNEDFRRRITSSFSYYSQFGAFLIFFNSFFLGLLFGKAPLKTSEKILLIALLAFGGIELFYTASRASWLAFGAAVLFFGIIRRSKIILGGLVIAAILAMFLVPKYMLIHFDADRKEQSASERLMLWRRAADVIKAHPFLGVGINTYNAVHMKYDTVKDTRVKGYYAHNGYLQLAAEIGLFGIGFFILFLILFFAKVLRKARDIPVPLFQDMTLGLLAGCFGFLCLVMVDTVLQSVQTSLMFWLFMGLTMTTLNIGLRSAPNLITSKGFLK
ncbi:MAG: O-antigen ligase family protein [Candidatus Omnitrophica bacterium]|nr:O-antigen ligase family protein [Candidatus Omnitrophota bacterium]